MAVTRRAWTLRASPILLYEAVRSCGFCPDSIDLVRWLGVVPHEF